MTKSHSYVRRLPQPAAIQAMDALRLHNHWSRGSFGLHDGRLLHLGGVGMKPLAGVLGWHLWVHVPGFRGME